ncbi:flagellin [Alphaproteobacteria bacterium GH1-50]|uniref:Flagellin n=1 Tax=Kangsaoukella pontilimi TaxID=2691042 RepID=A0A7C9ISQ5_9RHOB|nr:flagellin [Kangsaoukella pontilimi]MXQ08185.1 flagellin [Kangsaoukella pontilimi]
MASILTNTSAMVALQNLRTINSNLVDTQNQIATGKKIATAKDNSAIWAVSKVLESDVNAFKSISDSLNLGDSTVAIARQAAETVSDLLTELKGNIVAAQEENVDRSKIQSDIDAKVDQITSIISAAQFNGLSLVEGTDAATILGSLERDSSGNVSATDIEIARADLTQSAGTYGAGDQLADTAGGFNTTVSGTTVAETANVAVLNLDDNATTYSGDETITLTIGSVTVEYTATAGEDETDAGAFIAGKINSLGIEGVTATDNGDGTVDIESTNAFSSVDVSVSATGTNIGTNQFDTFNGAGPAAASGTIQQRAETITFDKNAAVKDGDGYQVTLNDGSSTDTFRYIAGPGETFEDVARGLKAAIDQGGIEGLTTKVSTDADGNFVLSIDNDTATSLTLDVDGREDGVASGGLFGLAGIDVTTNDGARAALDNIDTFLNTAIDAAASFGSSQSRIDLQAGFISKLTDSLKAGIGSLVDADLEAASARLQALQVQQQLGIQSLSIANQAPQSILALFR